MPVDFDENRKRSEHFEKCMPNFLNSKNIKELMNFHHTKDILNNPRNYNISKDTFISIFDNHKKGNQYQRDLVRIKDNEWESAEFKLDNPLTYSENLFIEKEDVSRFSGIRTITGPWRCLKKQNETLWLHFRDRWFAHKKEDIILYVFKIPKLVDFMNKNLEKYYRHPVINPNHITYGYIVPEIDLIETYEYKIPITIKQYNKYFI